jgi:hypothetical protein
MGAAFVLRDEEGALIMRGCWHANDVFSPELAEVFVLKGFSSIKYIFMFFFLYWYHP